MMTSNRYLLHFHAAKGWINDPNGLHRNADGYQKFYQYYPHTTEWGVYALGTLGVAGFNPLAGIARGA
ncbi:hypothetical protein [Neisseria perflava]|uniref:hypothetical protein n=1 Tax=Neisseria perflava TaxID=33053 RepID=UPI00209E38F0|nr:hypothetical protein [Neisseria perflava]MCP1660170.1 sucrose-6-phosphate hydrolase SacC (GH32 family) [Neisseria perflava]